MIEGHRVRAMTLARSESNVEVSRRIRQVLLTGTALVTSLAVSPARAVIAHAEDEGFTRSSEVRNFLIPPQPLGSALNKFSDQTGVKFAYRTDDVAGLRSTLVSGALTPDQALARMLNGTGLVSQRVSQQTVVVAQAGAADINLGTVVVQGEGEIPVAIEPSQPQEGHFGDPPPEPGGIKAEFQTTATKSALPLKQTPQAITVITPDLITARQPRDLKTALELTAGLTDGDGVPGPFSGQGSRTQASGGFALRGQNVFGGSGIRSDGFSISNLNEVDVSAFERFEVIKGPTGFFGQGPIAGFINKVRKKPKAEFEASGTVQIGSFDTYRGIADVTGSLNENDSLRGRLTASYEDSGSFVRGVETKRFMVAPSIEAHIGERTRVLAQFLYQEEEFKPNPGIPVKLVGNHYVIPDISRSLFAGVPNEDYNTSDTLDARLRIDHELTDNWVATLLLHGGKASRRDEQENYASAYYGLTAGGFTTLVHGKNFRDDDRWAGEVRLDGKVDLFGREHKLLFGLERNNVKRRDRTGVLYPTGYFYLYSGNYTLLPLANAPVPFNFTNRKFTTDNTAVYSQAILSLHDKTKLLFNARYDWASLKSENYRAGTTSSQNDEARTMRVGLVQDLTKNISAYTTWGQSFEPVSNISRTGILDPQTGEGYEAGLKTEWFNKKLGANLAVYRQELDNIPIPDPTNGMGESFFVSGGLHRTEGLEVEVFGSPLPGLTLAAAASWMDHAFIDPQDPNYGLSVFASVDRQYSLHANYEFQSGPLMGFGFGATLVSLGDRNYILGGQQVYADGYERLDLNFSYKGFKNLDVSLHVRNALDAKYIEAPQQFTANGHYLGSPTAVLFSLTKKLGGVSDQ